MLTKPCAYWRRKCNAKACSGRWKTVVRSKNHLSVGPVKLPNRPAASENWCASAWNVRDTSQKITFFPSYLIGTTIITAGGFLYGDDSLFHLVQMNHKKASKNATFRVRETNDRIDRGRYEQVRILVLVLMLALLTNIKFGLRASTNQSGIQEITCHLS